MSDPFEKIAGYYTKLIEKHGHNPKSCDYGSSVSQKIKFSTMTDLMPLDGKTMLDIGCGFADFADYLSENGFDVKYTGFDLCPSMIEKAKSRRPDLRLETRNILHNPPDEKFDIVTANGIFYLLGKEAPELSKRLIQAMFNLANEAVAFNSLSSWTIDQEEGEYYMDPAETLNFCRTLTPWISLRHNYHHRDFTVFMYKDKQ